MTDLLYLLSITYVVQHIGSFSHYTQQPITMSEPAYATVRHEQADVSSKYWQERRNVPSDQCVQPHFIPGVVGGKDSSQRMSEDEFASFERLRKSGGLKSLIFSSCFVAHREALCRLSPWENILLRWVFVRGKHQIRVDERTEQRDRFVFSKVPMNCGHGLCT